MQDGNSHNCNYMQVIPDTNTHSGPRVCPTCGTCPTCGRGNWQLPSVPYYPSYPVTTPVWGAIDVTHDQAGA